MEPNESKSDGLTSLAFFEGKTIRQTMADGDWYFSVIDAIEVLTESTAPRKYWNAMKARVEEESQFQLSSICRQLKLPAKDGKMRATDCANTEGMLRIVQYIPSPNAEPFRAWLASLGAERIEEVNDPEEAFNQWQERAIASFMAQGYSHAWAVNRVNSITNRKRLTNAWVLRDITAEEIPILTDRLHTDVFDITIEEHKAIKRFDVTIRQGQPRYKGDLRPAMTAMELALISAAEGIALALHEERNSHGFVKIADDVDDAGAVVRQQRLTVETQTGKPVVSPVNMITARDGGLWGLLPSEDEN